MDRKGWKPFTSKLEPLPMHGSIFLGFLQSLYANAGLAPVTANRCHSILYAKNSELLVASFNKSQMNKIKKLATTGVAHRLMGGIYGVHR
jgi:hypothetical protein